MISVSGKHWEEKKLNNRIIEKIKLENNFKDLTAKQIIIKNFDNEEIYSIDNNLEISNPFLNKSDFLKAIKLLDYAIKNNENICIIGDYDVDGCISTSLLVKFLKKMNASYFYYIPDRIKDGYGSSLNLIRKLITKKPNLVIMVDNGSSSVQAINYLNKNKIKSIIIDHHEIYEPYPKSNSLINPKKKSDYSKFNYFCSAVLTYFLIDLYIKKKKLDFNFFENLHLVLLAIISDVMPLRKTNRSIAQKVFRNINLNEDYFFKKIFDLKKIKRPFEIDDFGFLFGPILNSAGRLNDPNIVVELLTTSETSLKDLIINKLISLNDKRKKIEYNILKRLDFNKIRLENRSIIILEDINLNEGIIGIIASRIKTYFDKPTIVITKSSNIYKGSARSVENFPIGNLIKKALDKKLIETGGGHNLAAGFTVKKQNLQSLKIFLYDACKDNSITTQNNYLSKISLTALNKSFLLDLYKIQPFGQGNANPNFLIENIKIIKPKVVNGKFISCLIKNRASKMTQAISFNILESEISNNLLNNKNELNMIIQIKENMWNNKRKIQLIIIDILKGSNKA